MRIARDKNAGARLGRALLADARAFGCEVALAESCSRSWSSATFVGERVMITVTGGAGFGDWLESLAESELPVPEHYVAELLVTNRTASAAAVEALLIEAV